MSICVATVNHWNEIQSWQMVLCPHFILQSLLWRINQLLCSVPFTLSILYFRLLMHFLQGDQSESSIKGATSQLVKTWLTTFQMKRMSWRRPRMVRRLLRTKKPKNPKPEPKFFPFRNFHFGLASDPLLCRHIQEDSKEDTQDSGAESEKEKIQSLSLNNRRRLKKKRKRVILRIRRSLPRSLRGRRKEAKT